MRDELNENNEKVAWKYRTTRNDWMTAFNTKIKDMLLIDTVLTSSSKQEAI